MLMNIPYSKNALEALKFTRSNSYYKIWKINNKFQWCKISLQRKKLRGDSLLEEIQYLDKYLWGVLLHQSCREEGVLMIIVN